jgi:hypothetical protein
VFLSSRQKEVLEAQGKYAEYKKVADDKDRLNISRSTLHSINSNIFNNFREGLETMDEYFDIFDGRYKRHFNEVWDRMRSIRYKMKKGI